MVGPLSLGKFRLVALLGRGGMSDVFLAATDEEHVDFTKLVVIKKLREEFAQDAEFVMMFLDEARIAARLNHPNVIQTMEVGQTTDDYFLAMEYLDGQPLSRILSATSFGLPLGMHLSIVADALNGLHYAHELKDYDGTPLNVVHRDVTPHNVFVTYEGQVKVVDFGIAKAAGRAAETRVGVIKGKVGYMAPEQISLHPVDRRTDVYAVGVVLYEAATRKRMWEGVRQEDILSRVVHGDHPRSPRAKRPDVHPELDRIVQKALAFDPNDRYPTAAALQEDLEAFISEHEKRPSPRQLGSVVAARFGEHQEHARKVIKQQLTEILNSRRSIVTIEVDDVLEDAPQSSESSPRSNDLYDPVPRSQQTPSALLRSPTSDSNPRPSARPSNSPTETRLSPRPGASRRRLYELGAIGLIALAVMITAIVSTTRTGATAAANPGVPSEITLTLRATPLEAHFRVDDGPPLDNPYIARIPRDSKVHHIAIEAPGFVAETEETRFEQDVSFRFALAPRAK